MSYPNMPACAQAALARLFPDSWQDAWLARSLYPWNYYFPYAGLLLAFAVFAYGFLSRSLHARRQQELESAEHREVDEVNNIKKKQLGIARRIHIVANIFVWHGLAMMFMDVIVSLGFLDRQDIEPDTNADMRPPQNASNMLLAGSAAFLLVPAIQIVLVTWLLRRYAKKHGSAALHANVHNLRLTSTVCGLWWAAAAYVIVLDPVESAAEALTRYPVLQGMLGSAVVWLGAGSVFLYHMDKLEHQDPKICRGAWKWMFRLFDMRDILEESAVVLDEKMTFLAQSAA